VFQFCIPQAHVSRNFYKAVLYKGRWKYFVHITPSAGAGNAAESLFATQLDDVWNILHQRSYNVT
jgi:hypothetical protein